MDKKNLVEKWQAFLPPKKTKNTGFLYKFAKAYENTALENLNKNYCKILISMLYKVFSSEVDFELSKSTKNRVFIGSFPAEQLIDHNAIMIDFAIPHIESASKILLDKMKSGEITKLCALVLEYNKREYSVSAVF